MSHYVVFGFGAIFGFFFGFLVISLLCMAASRDRKALEPARQQHPPGGIGVPPVDLLHPAPGFTWCPNCLAMFRNELCPGCSPPPPEAA